MTGASYALQLLGRALDEQRKPVAASHYDHLTLLGSLVATRFPDLARKPHLTFREACRHDQCGLSDQSLGTCCRATGANGAVPEDHLTSEEEETRHEPERVPGRREHDQQDQRDEEEHRAILRIPGELLPMFEKSTTRVRARLATQRSGPSNVIPLDRTSAIAHIASLPCCRANKEHTRCLDRGTWTFAAPIPHNRPANRRLDEGVGLIHGRAGVAVAPYARVRRTACQGNGGLDLVGVHEGASSRITAETEEVG